jgi:hypothetical protein
MTDRPAPPPARQPARSNPQPRAALPRVTPLGADESADAVVDSRAPGDAHNPAQVSGRDIVISGGSSGTAAGPSRRRRSDGRSLTVPAVSELMPPVDPQRTGTTGRKAGTHRGAHGGIHGADDPVEAPRRSGSGRGGGAKRSKSHGGQRAERTGPEITGKQVDVVVQLPKSLRKRLKAKAAEHDLTPEQAILHLVSIWVDG